MKCLLLAALLVASSWAEMPDVEITALFLSDDTDSNGVLSQAEAIAALSNLDANKDSIVSRDEVKAVAGDTDTEAAVILRALDFNKDGLVNSLDAIAIFAAMDTNRDGQVTILEYANVYRSLPGQDEVKLIAIGADGVSLWFNSLDTNKDGQMSYAEFNAIFTQMDTNLDGRVTRSEYVYLQSLLQMSNAEADALFGRVDTNSDGFIDISEESAIFVGMDIDSSNTVSESEFVIGTIEPLRDVAVALARSGVSYPSVLEQLKQLGNSGLGQLFDQRDFNKDGYISLTEENAEFDQLDSDRDGRLTAAQMVPQYVTSLAMRTESAQVMFRALDTNDDGVLTKSDAVAVTTLGDSNRDGRLDKQEYIDLLTALIVLSKEVAMGKFTLPEARVLVNGVIGLGALFSTWDKDNNGLLTNAEFDSEIGSKLDLSRDGSVDQLEFMAAFSRTFQTNAQESQSVFYSIDSNHDGRIDSIESQAFYSSFDINKDGSVSVQEFTNNVVTRLAGIQAATAVATAGGLFG